MGWIGADEGPERCPPLPEEEPGRAEMLYYATCINARLGGDASLAHLLPLQPSRAQVVAACRDGILLWCAENLSLVLSIHILRVCCLSDIGGIGPGL